MIPKTKFGYPPNPYTYNEVDLGKPTPVTNGLPGYEGSPNGSVTCIRVGLCSYGAITDPVWSGRITWPTNYYSGLLGSNGYFTVSDWAAGTVWIINIPIHWTGTCWTGFCSLMVDTLGNYLPFPGYGLPLPGQIISGSNYVGGAVANRTSYYNDTPYPQGHLFADIPDLLHLGIGVVLRGDPQNEFTCGLSLTQFDPYNKGKKRASSGLVFPSGHQVGTVPYVGGQTTLGTSPVIVAASSSPQPPILTLVNANLQGTNNTWIPRTPLVGQISTIGGIAISTPVYYFLEYTLDQNHSNFTITGLAAVATEEDFNCCIGEQICPRPLPYGYATLTATKPASFPQYALVEVLTNGGFSTGVMQATGFYGSGLEWQSPGYYQGNKTGQTLNGLDIYTGSGITKQWYDYQAQYADGSVQALLYLPNNTVGVNIPAISPGASPLPQFVKGWGMVKQQVGVDSSGNLLYELSPAVSSNDLVYCQIPSLDLYCFALGGADQSYYFSPPS